MTVAEIKKLSGGEGIGYHFYQESDSGDVPFGDSEAVDLTQRPHFYSVPPATMRG